MDFDFPALDTRTLSESGVDMPVKRLDGTALVDRDGKPVTLRLLGPDSALYRRIQREQVQRRIARTAASGGTPADAAAFEADEVEATKMLVALTTGWAGVRDKAGAEVPFTPAAVQALYEGFPAIRDQVDNWVVNRRNFSTGSPTA